MSNVFHYSEHSNWYYKNAGDVCFEAHHKGRTHKCTVTLEWIAKNCTDDGREPTSGSECVKAAVRNSDTIQQIVSERILAGKFDADGSVVVKSTDA